MGSHGIKDQVAIVGDGLHAVRRALGQGHRRPAHRVVERGVRGRGRHQGRRRRLLARHRDVGHERHHARPPAAARRQARDPRRELLRHRRRGVAQRGLRGGQRRLRRGDGHRRREGEGLRLPGPRRRCRKPPTDGTARTLTAAAMFAMCVAGLRQEVRRRRRRDAPGARPHRVEEPLQRRPQPACAVPQGGQHRHDLQRAAHGRRPRRVRLLRAWPTARPSAIVVPGRRRAQATPTSRCTSRRCRSWRATARATPTPTTTTRTFPEIDMACAATPTSRPASPTLATQIAMAEVHDCFTPDRAAHHGGPRFRRAGHGLERGARGHLRPRRRPARSTPTAA